MTDIREARETIEAACGRHARIIDDPERCQCGYIRTSVVGDGTYRAHLTREIIAALSEAGITLTDRVYREFPASEEHGPFHDCPVCNETREETPI